jgi:hypothetical protein
MSLLSGAGWHPTAQQAGIAWPGTVVQDKIMALFVATQPSHSQRNGGYENLLAESLLMQHQMPSWTQRSHGTGLLGLTRPDRFAQGQHCARQIEIGRFLGQHGQAMENIGRRFVSSGVGEIVVNHGWRNLCMLSHRSVRKKLMLYAKKSMQGARTESTSRDVQ